MNLTAKFVPNLTIDEVLTYGLTSQTNEGNDSQAISYANGTSGTAQAIDLQFGKASIALAAGASITITLSSAVDDLGRTVNFAGGIRLFYLRVISRTAGDYLTVGQAASNPWTAMFTGTTPGLKVYDLAILGVSQTDKYAVTASSNDQIKITNSGSNPITFKVALLGCSA